MTTDERQQRMAERILEDENLRGDLEDKAANALVDWASKRAADAAADPDRSDAAVEAQVQAIRQAARAAALSGETAPKRLIALAAARLAPSQDVADSVPAVATNATDPAEPAMASGGAATERATPPEDAPQAREAPAPAAAVLAATEPMPDAPLAKQSNAPARKPAGSGTNRSPRKRSRLARFLKRVVGGR
jgi:hypothetical protein